MIPQEEAEGKKGFGADPVYSSEKLWQDDFDSNNRRSQSVPSGVSHPIPIPINSIILSHRRAKTGGNLQNGVVNTG